MCQLWSATLFVASLVWLTGQDGTAVSADLLGNVFGNFENPVSFVASIVTRLRGLARTIGKTIDAAVEEDCIFKCSTGMKPRPRPHHTPIVNGCGVPGLQIPKYVPTSQLEKCCNEHDICYGTCNENQQACDIQFKECLYKICASLKRYVSEDLLKGCKVVAKMMYTAVTAMGCKFYLEAQEEACVCYTNSHDEF